MLAPTLSWEHAEGNSVVARTPSVVAGWTAATRGTTVDDTALLREMRRQNAVVLYGLSGPDRWAVADAELDSVTTTLAHYLGVPYAGVHILDGDQQVTLGSAAKTPAPSVPRDETMCSAVLDHRGEADVIVVPDAAAVPWLRDNPFVDGTRDRIRFYAAAPLRTPTGLALGTLCVSSPTTRDLDEQERALLLHLGSAVVHVLERARRPKPGT